MRDLKFKFWDGDKWIYPEMYGADWDSAMMNGYEMRQYTGVDDEYGKGIYEGDRVTGREPMHGKQITNKVTFENGWYLLGEVQLGLINDLEILEDA